MVRVYVKGRGESPSPPRAEVKLERLEGMAVEELVDDVARQLSLDKEELYLMYGGNILMCGKTVDHYNIKDGCTLHIMPQRNKVKFAPLPFGPEGMTVVFASPTIQSEVAEFIQDPEVVAKMIPMANVNEVRELLKDPSLLEKMSDMSRINHHIHKNYLLFPVMKALLKLHRVKYSVQDTGRMDRLSVQVGQILELASSGADGLDSDYGQEEVVVPSQASTSHPLPGSQVIHGSVHSATPDSSLAGPLATETASTSDGASAAPVPRVNLTTADLASALASISTDQAGSGPSSLQSSALPSLGSSPQPLSLPALEPHYTGSSAPASLRETDLLPVPPTMARSLSDSGRGARETTSSSQPDSISERDLQEALSLALGSVQQQTSSQPAAPATSHSHRSGSHRHHRHSSQRREQTLREQYMPHLEQLHAMGIRFSDSECLHALEAAEGDLQMALEILMGPGS
jgi:hypothetical protein